MRCRLQTSKWFPPFPMIAIIQRQRVLDVAKEMGKARRKQGDWDAEMVPALKKQISALATAYCRLHLFEGIIQTFIGYRGGMCVFSCPSEPTLKLSIDWRMLTLYTKHHDTYSTSLEYLFVLLLTLYFSLIPHATPLLKSVIKTSFSDAGTSTR